MTIRPDGPLIHVDTSVVLAQLLAEERHPATTFWDGGPFVSSRHLQDEVWDRIDARGLGSSHGEDARAVIARLGLLEMVAPVMARALEPFPAPVRTQNALQPASVEFLRALGQRPALAPYDRRLLEAPSALEIPVIEPYRRPDALGRTAGRGVTRSPASEPGWRCGRTPRR